MYIGWFSGLPWFTSFPVPKNFAFEHNVKAGKLLAGERPKHFRPPLHASCMPHAAMDKCPWRAADVVFQCQTEQSTSQLSVWKWEVNGKTAARWQGLKFQQLILS